nr:SulP family inorganic anion transporter [Micromonospora sp. DSM 115978]
TALFSGATLTFLLVAGLWARRLPGRVPLPVPLLAVLLATLAVAGFGLADHGIAVVGAVPSGLPAPSLPPLGELPSIVLPALGVLLVGYTDNVLTGRAFAVRKGEQVDADQELLALGGANVAAGLFSGFPV